MWNGFGLDELCIKPNSNNPHTKNLLSFLSQKSIYECDTYILYFLYPLIWQTNDRHTDKHIGYFHVYIFIYLGAFLVYYLADILLFIFCWEKKSASMKDCNYLRIT